MDREQLLALIHKHRGNGTWCDGCSRQVGNLAEHLANTIMPQGVDYLLEGRWLDDEADQDQGEATRSA